MTYENEFFADVPAAAMPGESASPITKVYQYGRTKELEVRLHENSETSVLYIPSALLFTLPAGERKAAFDFASERREHMRMIGI